MTTIKTKIKNTFNKAIKSYDMNCQLQKTIGDHLLHFMMPYHFEAPRMIDLGCGTGIVTEKLASAFPYQEFHAVDFADHLLEKASQRLSHIGINRVNVYHADFECLPSPEPFDIIFSNMALHWSVNLQRTLNAITLLLKENGIVAFSIPLSGSLDELQPYFSINQFAKFTDISNQLIQNKCEMLIQKTEKITLHFNDTLSALKSIKNVGANSVNKPTSAHLHGKSFLNKIKLTKLTYHIGYFIARKTETACQSNYLLLAPTQMQAKRTSVSEY